MIRDILYYFTTIDNLETIVENNTLFRSNETVKVRSADLRNKIKSDTLTGIILFTNQPKIVDNNSDTIRFVFERHKIAKKVRLYENLNSSYKGKTFMAIEDIENISGLITQINILDFSANISTLKKIGSNKDFYNFPTVVVKKFVKF